MWYNLSANQTAVKLKTDLEKGLTEKEVEFRKKLHGSNELKKGRETNLLDIIIDQFRSSVVLLLVFAGVVSFLLGMRTDAMLIFFILTANTVIGVIQDYRARKAIEELRKLSAPKCIVIRDGVAREVDPKELVPGDVIIVSQGNIVPADARIVECDKLLVDESLLTGESKPRPKSSSKIEGEKQIFDQTNMLFMNTVVLKGKAKAVVVSTGNKTEVGKIANKMLEIKQERTPLQKQLDTLGKKLTIITTGVIILTFIIGYMIHTTDIVHLFMQSVSLGVAAIPEGLPAVVTLTLAFGTRRMLSRKVLVKRLPSVETLGSVDVICTDKTGTLTQNKMKVSSIFASGWIRVENDKIVPETTVLSEELIDKIAQCSFYCNESNRIGNKWIGSHVDVALKEFGEKNLRTKCKVVSIEPFDPERKMMSAECEANKKKVLYKKGAPEVIIKQCTKVYYKGRVAYLTDNVKKIYIEAYEKMSSKALYVLALAQDDVLIGLVGMEDPPREGVKEAINSCYNAGINVIMITGDNIRNAEAVADKVGLKYKSSVTGDYVRNITDEELEEVVEKTNIFARITPRDKLRILEALQRKGHIVAMTGDGVNDAPALKKADVGVAMGLRGTEVAKQASDIVLTDDNFVTIKEAIKQGRTIYNNIRKFVNYLLTCNIAEVLVVLITSLMGYLAITPIQILWINLITDGLPAVALGFDPPSADIMSKKPRKKNEPILNKQLRRVISAISIKKTLVLITLFLAFLRFGIKEARTMLLMGFVVYELVRIGVIKYLDKTSYWSNRILVAAVIISLGLQGLILYTPLSRLFSVVPLGLPHLGVLMIVAMFGYWSGILLTKLVTKDTAQA